MSHNHCSTHRNLKHLKKHVEGEIHHSTKHIDHNIGYLEDDIELCCDTLQANITEGFNAIQTSIDTLTGLIGTLQSAVDALNPG